MGCWPLMQQDEWGERGVKLFQGRVVSLQCEMCSEETWGPSHNVISGYRGP